MANFFKPNYDPRVDSASSAVEVSDLKPEQSRDVDLRRLDPEERSRYSDVFKDFAYTNQQENAQDKIGKFMRAAKVAGEYKTRAGIAEPTIRGKTPRNPGIIDGAEVPSMGDAYGPVGSTNYANKPGRAFGNI